MARLEEVRPVSSVVRSRPRADSPPVGEWSHESAVLPGLRAVLDEAFSEPAPPLRRRTLAIVVLRETARSPPNGTLRASTPGRR